MANSVGLHHLSRNMTKPTECVPSEDSDQPGHPPSLIWVFVVRMKKPWALRYPLTAQRRLWWDWEDAQADLSLRWAHTHCVGFVMSWLICSCLSVPILRIFTVLVKRKFFILCCKVSSNTIIEPQHDKRRLWSFRPGQTQTGLYSHRS